ncbi:MAG: hypothetical protein Q7V62_14330 [Actinomycetota bacterium]|nr:hypothetical protein [Actinomycetota bacterium]
MSSIAQSAPRHRVSADAMPAQEAIKQTVWCVTVTHSCEQCVECVCPARTGCSTSDPRLFLLEEDVKKQACLLMLEELEGEGLDASQVASFPWDYFEPEDADDPANENVVVQRAYRDDADWLLLLLAHVFGNSFVVAWHACTVQ